MSPFKSLVKEQKAPQNETLNNSSIATGDTCIFRKTFDITFCDFKMRIDR